VEVELRHALLVLLREGGGGKKERRRSHESGERTHARVLRDQVNRMRNAISRAKSATASVSAKPRMPRPNTWSRAEGLRATLETSEEKMLPMPMPTPARAITAIRLREPWRLPLPWDQSFCVS